MTQNDLVTTSLEHVAESGVDISAEIYDRFAARCPDWAALMSHMDAYMRGRMMQDVLTLLMTEPEEIDASYLSFEVSSHRAYGVTPDMFPPLFQAVQDTLRSHLGAAWSPEMAEAWNQRIEALGEKLCAADLH